MATTTATVTINSTDLLGRPSKENSNQLLFYIYSDGTIEKKNKI